MARQELASMPTEGMREIGIFKQTEPLEKWIKRRTTIKVKVKIVLDAQLGIIITHNSLDKCYVF